MRIVTAALLIAGLAAPAGADETKTVLKKAPGVDRVESQCSACHSLDYIEMNSPFQVFTFLRDAETAVRSPDEWRRLIISVVSSNAPTSFNSTSRGS